MKSTLCVAACLALLVALSTPGDASYVPPTPTTAAGTTASAALPVQGVTGGVPVPATVTTALPSGTNTIGAVAAPSYTPAAPSGSLTLTTGGTAQTFASAGSATHGGWILNPSTATQQGIATAESVFVNMTGSAAAASAGGQSFEVLPGQILQLPAGVSVSISWIAATTGHKITAMVF